MKNEELIVELKKIVAPFINEKKEISLNDDLSSDLGLDSIDLVDIIINIEDTFLIKFSDNELDSFKKVNELIDIIQDKCKGKVVEY